MQNDKIFNGYGVGITLPSSGDFLKIRETLSRIGVESIKQKTLFQSCHILHKRGLYAIMHFKELFLLDGKDNSNLTDNDVERRNMIVSLLRQWRLVSINNELDFDAMVKSPMNQIKIIQYSDKHNWSLKQKYNIGKPK